MPAAAQAPTAEDGMAIVEARATILRDGRVRLTVRCVETTNPVPCSGRAALRSLTRVPVGPRHRRIVPIASVSFRDIPPGATRQVVAPLDREARYAAARRCRLRAAATVERSSPPAPAPSGTADVAQPIVVVENHRRRACRRRG